jgi:hypothetical protein
MAFLTTATWNRFKNIINEASDDFFQQDLIWRRSTVTMQRFGEDPPYKYQDVTLLGLFLYNDFRTWPSTLPSQSGETDPQTLAVMFNLKYLQSRGFINANGNFMYDSAADRFIIDGQVYKEMGSTKAAQAKDNPLLIQLVLKKEEIVTGSKNV